METYYLYAYTNWILTILQIASLENRLQKLEEENRKLRQTIGDSSNADDNGVIDVDSDDEDEEDSSSSNNVTGESIEEEEEIEDEEVNDGEPQPKKQSLG